MESIKGIDEMSGCLWASAAATLHPNLPLLPFLLRGEGCGRRKRKKGGWAAFGGRAREKTLVFD